jgi:hypothetical protein
MKSANLFPAAGPLSRSGAVGKLVDCFHAIGETCKRDLLRKPTQAPRGR